MQEKWRSNPVCWQRFASDMAQLFLRRSVRDPSDIVARQWVSTGLLKKNRTDDRLEPVSEFVLEAATEEIRNAARGTLRELAKGTGTSWSAIELFVSYACRRAGRITISGTDVQGLQSDHFIVECSGQSLLPKEASVDPDAYVREKGPFLRGTLLVLWESHPVADLVVYASCFDATGNSLGAKLLFIQVSQSSYAQHSSKLPELGNVPSAPTRWNYSVMQTYRKLFNVQPFQPRRTDISKGKLPDDTRYVYVTTDVALMKRTNANAGHEVTLVSGVDRISAMDPVPWSEIVD